VPKAIRYPKGEIRGITCVNGTTEIECEIKLSRHRAMCIGIEYLTEQLSDLRIRV